MGHIWPYFASLFEYSPLCRQDECSAAFMGMENVQEATCVGSPYDAGSGGVQYNVTFSRWPRQVRRRRKNKKTHENVGIGS